MSDKLHRWIKSQRRSKRETINFWKKRPASFCIRLVERLFIVDSISNLVVRDISSLERLGIIQNFVTSIEKLEDPIIVERPNRVFSEVGLKIYDVRRSIFRYGIKDARVHLRSGLSGLFGGFIVEELYPSYMTIFGSGTVLHEYRKIKKSKFETLSGSWVVVENPRYYFHFIAQTLPTILRSLDHVTGPRIVCHSDAPLWLRDLLISLDAHTYFTKSEVVHLEHAVFTSAPEIASNPEVELIRKSLAQFQSVKQSTNCFIGRPGKHRNLGLLESELTKNLNEKGINVIDPESFTWNEELAFFASLSKAVIVNGSGVANLVWMQPDSEVIILIDGGDFSTQIEKAFLMACKIKIIEIDIREYRHTEHILISKIIDFLS